MPEDIVKNVATQIINEFNDDLAKYFSKEEWNLLRMEQSDLRFDKGEYIIKEGSVPKGIFCVTKGKAKLYKNGFNGKEQILRFIQEGDVIGYRSILCDEVFGASATALEKNLEGFSFKQRHKMLEISPKLAFEILKLISHELGEAGKTITILAQKTVRERLAEILLLLEEKLGTNEYGFINITLTREEIANLIGTATESAIRLMSEFKADDLIEVEGRKIKLTNKEKLHKLANIK